MRFCFAPSVRGTDLECVLLHTHLFATHRHCVIAQPELCCYGCILSKGLHGGKGLGNS